MHSRGGCVLLRLDELPLFAVLPWKGRRNKERDFNTVHRPQQSGPPQQRGDMLLGNPEARLPWAWQHMHEHDHMHEHEGNTRCNDEWSNQCASAQCVGRSSTRARLRLGLAAVATPAAVPCCGGLLPASARAALAAGAGSAPVRENPAVSRALYIMTTSLPAPW